MFFPDHLRLPLDFDPDRLAHDLATAASSGWIGHFVRQTYDGEWDVIPLRAPLGARRPAAMVLVHPMTEHFEDTPVLAACPYFRQALGCFQTTLRAVRLMRLAPGSVIKEHVDQFLDIEDGAVRLHIPVITNSDVDFRISGKRLQMAPGTAWYMGVGNPHSVVNRGSSDRVHLVIDATLNAWLVDLLETAEHASEAR
jgi:mannose-6-phosphate isomerase-like protein (cupin superfamily)